MARCTANSTRSGERCKKPPMRGGSVCRNHGGAAAQVRRAAKRRLVQQRVTKLLDDIGGEAPPVTDPAGELAALLGRIKTIEQLLWAELHSDDSAHPDPIAVEVYQQAVDRLGKFLIEAQKLGILEQAVQVRREQAVMLAAVFQHTLADIKQWLAACLTEQGVDTATHYALTRALDQRARESFRVHALALPTESEPAA